MDKTSTAIIAAALMVIMFGMGLSLTLRDFGRVFRQPKAIVVGVANQMAILPLVGFGLATWLHLRPDVAIGIMILAACPGGATSNLVAHLAKGDTALSISLTAVTSLATILSIPLLVRLAFGTFLGEGQALALDVPQMIGQLMAIVVAPVIVGMALRAKATAFAMRMDRPVRMASTALLIMVTVGLVIKERHNVIPYFMQAGLPAVLLNVATMAIGFGSAHLFRLGPRRALTIAIESGIQNSTLAITIATVSLQKPTYGIAAAIYSLVMYAGAFLAIRYGRKTISPLSGRPPA